MQSYKKPGVLNIIIGIVFAVLFVITLKVYVPKYSGNTAVFVQLVSFAEIFIALFNLLPKKVQKVENKREVKKYSRLSVAMIIFSLVLVVATVLAGHYVFKGEKFTFICLLIIAELLIPFLLSFENKKPSARELVIIAVICALAVAGRSVFYAIPQFKPIGAIVIVSAICLGAEKGFIIGAVSALVSNMFFGHGSWTAFQMLGFGLLGLFAGVFFSKGILPKTPLAASIFGAVSTIILYGGVVNFSSLIYYPQITWDLVYTTYIVYGLPFDLLHAVSTAFFLWFITEPAVEKLERIKVKYGLF